MKGYRALAAFHVTMVGFYVAIIGALQAGWTRLSIAIQFAAALAIALAGLLVCWRCARLLLLKNLRTRLRRLRHQLKRRRIGRADGPPSGRIAEKLELEPPPFGVITRMSDQPGSQPGFGAADSEPERPKPPVDGPDSGPLLGERFER